MALKTRGTKTNYPSDVSEEEWAFGAPYLTLMKVDAPQWIFPRASLLPQKSPNVKRVHHCPRESRPYLNWKCVRADAGSV
jgi:hypothetical protein